MKKLLTATTALALVGGAAFAEITISGDAKLGLDYNSDPGEGASKHSFKHEMGVDFTGAGTTDGGLSFGGKAGFDTGDDTVNTGTVWVSSEFGKITIGDNDAADLLAGGIADVGLNGVGVDNVVEDHRGTTAKAIRYDHSFGSVKIAVSAGTVAGTAAVAGKDAVAATEWKVTDHNNAVLAFSDVPSLTQYSSPFGITHTIASEVLTEINVNADGAGTATNIFGYSRGEKGTGDNATGIFDGDNNELDSSANAAAVADFERYEMAFDLGTDKTAGAGDTRKMQSDNAMAAVAGTPGTSSDNQYAFGMSFEAGGMTVGFGHDSMDTNSIGLGFSTGDISTNVLYVKADGATGMGGDVSYTMGASTVTLAYANSDPDSGDKVDALGGHVSHDLGGGAKFNAGFAQVDDVNKASVGLSFSF